MTNWGDGKRFLFEDIVLYVLLLLLALSWDYCVNFLSGMGISLFTHELYHPASFGKGQLVLVLFSTIQLFRKLSAFKYYA